MIFYLSLFASPLGVTKYGRTIKASKNSEFICGLYPIQQIVKCGSSTNPGKLYQMTQFSHVTSIYINEVTRSICVFETFEPNVQQVTYEKCVPIGSTFQQSDTKTKAILKSIS
eukprot:NODE_89_length_21781_cov_0.895836.p22 type:complete len:113 gc:universal NODE_89_length_21781_cov_0.895836:17046-16708(-)